MTPELQQQLVDHAPFAALFSGMVLVGSLINRNATDSVVQPSRSWCTNTSTTQQQLEELVETMPVGLGAATIIVVIIFPIIPVIFNSQTKKWNDFKIEILKCHVMGQGSVFGVSEILRHLLTVPEPAFLHKCNITVEECSRKSMAYQLPFNEPPKNNSFCQAETLPPTDLFNSLHHFPDNTCGVIGASIVTFLATLYFWSRINKNGKSIYDVNSFKKFVFIIIQLSCITLILFYLYELYHSLDSIQMLGLLIGALLQLLIILTSLPNKENK